MTITTQDVVKATAHETRDFEYGATPLVKPSRIKTISWADVGISLVFIWFPTLMAASGLGLLLEAIVDTVRYGAPR